MHASNGEHAPSDHAAPEDELAHAPTEDDAAAETGFNGVADATLTTVATVGVVGVAAVVFEAALIPGMVLGVAAALAPSYVPRLGAALNPLLRSGIRGAYKLGHKTREIVSEAREHMNDIAAEVEAEKDVAVSAGPNGKASEAPRA